jgi:hypothetical protein
MAPMPRPTLEQVLIFFGLVLYALMFLEVPSALWIGPY